MNKKILIIEDDTNAMMLYKEELEKEGYQILTASSGIEGLSIIEEEKLDLVILDLRMPEMDGLEVLGKVLVKRKNLPVVIFTSYPEYKNNFLSWAADAYIIKSVDLSELKNKIKELIGNP
ncbi:MAG: response regulator [bacterium]|nr:response regulator [bacterium]MCX7916628.1 response regulator [bacterium]MDW8163704.1 response regulator [Candidatus Omnitrophota bacterium]